MLASTCVKSECSIDATFPKTGPNISFQHVSTTHRLLDHLEIQNLGIHYPPLRWSLILRCDSQLSVGGSTRMDEEGALPLTRKTCIPRAIPHKLQSPTKDPTRLLRPCTGQNSAFCAAGSVLDLQDTIFDGWNRQTVGFLWIDWLPSNQHQPILGLQNLKGKCPVVDRKRILQRLKFKEWIVDTDILSNDLFVRDPEIMTAYGLLKQHYYTVFQDGICCSKHI